MDLVALGGEALAPELREWLATSPRFRTFAEAHRDKIRKKLRGAAGDPDALLDVRAELAVARLLLRDRRFDLAFEGYGSGRRGPDFTVTFRASRPFDLEVTRPHRPLDGASIVATVLTKLPHLRPSIANLLLIATKTSGEVDIAAEIRSLRRRADAKDEDLFLSRGFAGTRDFYERFLRLGAVIVWEETPSTDEGPGRRATVWTNGSARIDIPTGATRALQVALEEAPERGDRYRQPSSGAT